MPSLFPVWDDKAVASAKVKAGGGGGGGGGSGFPAN